MRFANGWTISGLMLAVVMGLTLPAVASADPSFDYGKVPAKKKGSPWAVQAKAGLILSGGNATSTSVTAGASAAYVVGKNRFQLSGDLAYARSTIYGVDDANGNGVVDPGEIIGDSQTTTQLYDANARYDRFFGGEHNSAYVSAGVLSDVPSGKKLYGGGQIGYSRTLFKNDTFLTLAEIGYDFTYQQPVEGDGVSIHSARLFVQQDIKFNETVALRIQGEFLENLNEETAPNENGTDTVGSFHDPRINASANLTVALSKHFSLAFGFGLKYDAAPALRPAPNGPDGKPLSYAAGYTPFAKKLDTLTQAALVVSFL